jgi:hypothetical protein
LVAALHFRPRQQGEFLPHGWLRPRHAAGAAGWDKRENLSHLQHTVRLGPGGFALQIWLPATDFPDLSVAEPAFRHCFGLK